jgi:hypothetical protein
MRATMNETLHLTATPTWSRSAISPASSGGNVRTIILADWRPLGALAMSPVVSASVGQVKWKALGEALKRSASGCARSRREEHLRPQLGVRGDQRAR